MGTGCQNIRRRQVLVRRLLIVYFDDAGNGDRLPRTLRPTGSLMHLLLQTNERAIVHARLHRNGERRRDLVFGSRKYAVSSGYSHMAADEQRADVRIVN